MQIFVFLFRKGKRYAIETFSQKNYCWNLRKQSSIMLTPRSEELIQELYLNKELKELAFLASRKKL